MLTNPNNNIECIKVAIRVRPFLRSENNETQKGTIYIDPEDERKIKIGKDINFHEGFYDKIFSYFSTQNEIFNFVKPSIDDVLNGINCTIFTYGQTGSGKTYTMFGSDWTLNEISENYSKILSNITYDNDNFIKNDFPIDPFSDENGICPRMINQVFRDIDLNSNSKKRFTVYCSYMQIYNEKIYDLLTEEVNNINTGININNKANFNTYMKDVHRPEIFNQKSLNIRESKVNGIYVEGLTEYIVENVYDCINLLKRGEKNRKKRQTGKNEMSSRSHTIFMFMFEGATVNKNGTLKVKINLTKIRKQNYIYVT
jgi:hypothetical protein